MTTASELINSYEYWESDEQRKEFATQCLGLPLAVVDRYLSVMNRKTRFVEMVKCFDDCVQHWQMWQDFQDKARPEAEALAREIAIADGSEPPAPVKADAGEIAAKSQAWHTAVAQRDAAREEFKENERKYRAQFEAWIQQGRNDFDQAWDPYVAKAKAELDKARG